MAFIDSHCHLDFPQLQNDFPQTLLLAAQNDVLEFVVPSVSASNFSQVIALGQLDAIHIALGMHPCFMSQHKTEHLAQLEALVLEHQPCAVGEIGLDFLISASDEEKTQQLALFDAQLHIAKKANLPVIMHVRKAHDVVLMALKKHKFKEGGIVHAFNGSMDQALRYTQEFGFKLGFGGTLTYQGSTKLRALAASLPLQDIVLETDAPDMALANMVGDFNQPANIKYIAQTLMSLRGESADLIEQQIILNTRQCLGLKTPAII